MAASGNEVVNKIHVYTVKALVQNLEQHHFKCPLGTTLTPGRNRSLSIGD